MSVVRQLRSALMAAFPNVGRWLEGLVMNKVGVFLILTSLPNCIYVLDNVLSQ